MPRQLQRGRERGRGSEPESIRLDVKIDGMEQVLTLLYAIHRQGRRIMAAVDDAIAKVQAQGTQIAGIKVLIAELRAAAGDPAKMTALLTALDTNATGLTEALNTTPAGEPVPDLPPGA